MISKGNITKQDLIYPELSYDIVGCAYDVFNELTSGHMEKVYQNAMAVALKQKNIPFSEQVYYSLKFKGETVGRGYLDFLIDGKVIVELKKDERFSKAHIEQVLNYLKLSKLQLAILINFTAKGVVFRRIVNVQHS